MAKLKISYTKDALDDLDSIFAYISDDNRVAALGLLQRIEASICRLAENPRMGVVVRPFDPCILESGYRYVFEKPYMVFYRIGTDTVFISRVLHSRQNWLSLIFDNDFTQE